MMEKRNVIEPKRTRCDLCSEPAIKVTDNGVYCEVHEEWAQSKKNVKMASVKDMPLKNASDVLTKEYN